MKFSADNNPGIGFRLGTGLGVSVTIGLAFLTWLAPNIVMRLDNTALDFQLRLRGERSPGQEVVLVLVDEKSLKEIGRWPWLLGDKGGHTSVGSHQFQGAKAACSSYRLLYQDRLPRT